MKKSNLKKRLLSYPYRVSLIAVILFCIISLILFTFGCSSPDNTNFKEAANDQANNNQSSSDYSEEDIEEEQENEPDNSLNKDTAAKDNEQTEEEEEEEVAGSNEELTTKVYYADEQGEYLVSEARVVSSANKYVDALNEIMKKPIDSSLINLVPDTTLINSITIEDGLAKIDLSKNFVENRLTSDVGDNLLVYSVVNTLTEFSEINFVTFYIDGEKLDTLGMLDLKDPISRRSDLIKNQ